MKRFILALCLLAFPVLAQTEAENGLRLRGALDAAEKGDFDDAARIAARIPDDSAQSLVTWLRLREGVGTFGEYHAFLKAHPDWPGLRLLRRRGEDKIPPFFRPSAVRAYFVSEDPQTGAGAMRLTEAFQAQGLDDAATQEIIRAWTTMTLSSEEESAIFAGYRGIVGNHHRTRLNNLLWEGKLKSAERMLPRVDAGYRALAEARIALQRRARGVDTKIAAVPANWQDHPGLAYDRFQWRIRKDRWDDAQAFIADRAGNALGKPEKWANRRRGFARRAMRAGDLATAYRIAANHGLNSGANYADLEWIAGYVALKRGDARRALTHFSRFRLAVETPISQARAAYWLSRTHTALGLESEAQASVREAAIHQTTFYGQLAADVARLGGDPTLAGGSPVEWRKAPFVRSSVFRAGLLLLEADEPVLARRFFAHMAETLPEREVEMLGDAAIERNAPFVAIGIAKQAARRGIILPRAYFPLLDIQPRQSRLPPELPLAVARRESELRLDARSPAGALGLMQLMPRTARQMASTLKTPFDRARLTSDGAYNARLGTLYLNRLLARYDGSLVLALAAYNAGPARADRWIETYGDPRNPAIDVVDWIESIPYRETRNYVMRVMEGLHVYRTRMAGRRVKPRIVMDLRNGLGPVQ